MGIRTFLNNVCHVPIDFIPLLVLESHLRLSFQASYYHGVPADHFDWGEAPENAVSNTSSSRTAIASSCWLKNRLRFPRQAITYPSDRFAWKKPSKKGTKNYVVRTSAARAVTEFHTLFEITEACAYMKEHTRVTDEQKNLIKEKCFTPVGFDWKASALAQAAFSFAKHVLTKREEVVCPTKIARILRDCNISEEFIPLDAIRKRLTSSRQILHPSDEFDWEEAIITNNNEN